MTKPRHIARKICLIVGGIVAIYILVVISALVYGKVHESMVFSSASPAMKQLAAEAGMSHQGQYFFYSAHPQLDSLEQLAKDCADKNANDGYIEQGCFDPSSNRIYIRDMPSSLKQVEIVTAAHEMLHVAYSQLSSEDRDQTDKLVEQSFKKIDNAQLNSRMKEYAHLEPGARDNELHSILGTEFKNLTPSLEKYYEQYFTNRDKPVAANAKVNDMFQQQQNKLAYIRGVISSLESDAQTLYSESVAAAKSGDAQGDQHYYNLYTDKINDINGEIGSYNQLLEQYNALSAEYNGQPNNKLSPVSPHGSS